MKRLKFGSIFLPAIIMCGCSGMRQSGDQLTAHAESFNIVGLRIPGDSQDAAMAQLPSGAEVHTVQSNPSDWTSLPGIVNRIIGVSYTEVSAKVKG